MDNCRVCQYLEENQYDEKIIRNILNDNYGKPPKGITKNEIEAHNKEWTYGDCGQRYRKYKEKKNIQEIKKQLQLIQHSHGNCPLCAVESSWINEGIFFRNWQSEEVKKELKELNFPIIVTDREIFIHKSKHLSVKNKNNKYDNKKHIENIQKSIKKRNNVNDLSLIEHVDSQILTLSIDIREMEQDNLTNTNEYKNKIELLKSFIDLKLKVEGGDVQDVNVVGLWEKIKQG